MPSFSATLLTVGGEVGQGCLPLFLSLSLSFFSRLAFGAPSRFCRPYPMFPNSDVTMGFRLFGLSIGISPAFCFHHDFAHYPLISYLLSSGHEQRSTALFVIDSEDRKNDDKCVVSNPRLVASVPHGCNGG